MVGSFSVIIFFSDSVISKPSPHTRALLQAFLVTFLWSTSWVLIKIGLLDLPALLFSGLRYALAFLFLLPVALQPSLRPAYTHLKLRQWLLLAVYGLVLYSVAQGALFLGLAGLPSATVGLMLNFTSVLVAFLGWIFLRERLGWLGWAGIAVSTLGALVYFYPVWIPPSQMSAFLAITVGVLANAVAVILGRTLNHREGLPALVVTSISMGLGGFVLLAVGLSLDGIPQLTWNLWAIIAWLALVNTAFAFTLWNHTQRTLPAVETSLVNNTMLVQIALLAWFFLGESLTGKMWLGMLLVLAGVALLQLSYRPSRT